MNFSTDKFEIIHRTAVYAPQPYKGSMRMLKFPNGTSFAPQPWVPTGVANYCSFQVDVTNAFDNLGSLFDAMFNEGKAAMVVSGPCPGWTRVSPGSIES